jgi:Afadin- and alpha -actinin-Binding
LRADTLRQTTDFERLQIKHTEAQRRLGLAEATERALKAQIRSAEQAAKGLKEEMGRMKILVGQTRAQCANEVRKRERLIEGLKKHVGEGGRSRGSGKAVGVAVINVTAGTSIEEGISKAVSTDESGYDLRMETNEFLTELAKSLSEENENMGGLLRRTVEALATLSGWERVEQQEGGALVRIDASFESLANDIDGILEHLRTLLTNPSFVPLEEVEVREDEIIRLREGWEKMEARWREAVQMMDGWRKRMAKSGQTVNLEELKMGLRLSPVKILGFEEAVNGTEFSTAEEEYQGEGDTQADINAMDDSQVPAISDPTPELDLESDEENDGESPINRHQDPQENTIHTESSISPLGTPPQLSPLREAANASNRGKYFTTIVEENTWDLAHLDKSPSNIESEASLKTSNTNHSPQKVHLSAIKQTSTSRLPRPAPAMAQQSPLTMASIAAKLAATEREADAARVRAKLKAAKLSSATVAPTTLKPPIDNSEYREPVKESGPTVTTSKKRKAIGKLQGGRASRRRSTLSPWELESLILGGAALTPAKDSGS